jgi:phosphohistidine phosphatase
MNRTLLLLRHGEALASGTGNTDRNRPLSPRGFADVRALGKRLAEKGIVPDYVCCSAATRTQQTATELLAAMGAQPQLIVQEELYNADLTQLMAVMNALPNTAASVLMVGHNPTLTEAVAHISHHHLANIPPAGLVAFTIKQPRWEFVQRGSCVFEWFDFG